MAPFLIVCFFALVESSKIRFETEAERSTRSSTTQPIKSTGHAKGHSHDHRPGKRTPKHQRSHNAHMQVSADGGITHIDEAEPTTTDQDEQEYPHKVERDVNISEYNPPKSDGGAVEPAAPLQQEPKHVPQHRQLGNDGEPEEGLDAKHHRSHMQQTMRIEDLEDPDTLVESGSMVSTKHRHRDVNAPVLGGVIGGVLVVALIMLAYKRYSEMRIRHRTQDLRSPTPSSATPPSPREVERQNDRTPSKPERPTKIDYAAVRSRK